jgi:Ser/Thr protein kinase RdoA (MazF antagonist)
VIDVNTLEPLANAAVSRWGLGHAAVRVLNHSENTIFLVTPPAGDAPYILRVHRPGYHSRDGIRSELAWAQALQAEAGVKTPQALPGADGELIQTVEHAGVKGARHCVLFRFIDGAEPDQETLIGPFRQLGEIAARMHRHGRAWARPEYYERLVWDVDHCIGDRTYWGSWRDGPNLDAIGRAVLERATETIERRLRRFGQSSHRYGLVHADIRLANLLVQDGETRVIDFDDCGEGWFLYDAATAVSFIEHRRDIDELMDAWCEGYRHFAELPEDEAREIWSFIMMRRLCLLGWIGSHAETETARQLAPTYGPESVDLAERYLSRFG